VQTKNNDVMKKVILLSVLISLLGVLAMHAQTNSALAMYEGDKHSKVDYSDETASSKSAVPTWEFLSGITSQFSTEEINNNNYALGGKMGCMMQLVKSLYVTKEEVVPGDPQTRTVIRKPEIFNAVNNVEKFLKKQVKEKQMALEDAQRNLNQVIEVALAAIDTEETNSFEEALHKNRKQADYQLEVFKKVKVKSIY
jgi:hypothetical protein